MENITAVQWLKTEIEKYGDPEYLVIRWTDLDELINHVKQMEKEQIIKAYNQELYGGLSGGKKFDDGEQYYNETFGNK